MKGRCISNPELITNEVKNKLSGGVNLIDYYPHECPWCNSDCDDMLFDDHEKHTVLGEVTHYTEFLTCKSCNKRWAVGYSRVFYEELHDEC